MGKFHGIIGYANTTEAAPGVWKDDYVEKEVKGEVLDLGTRWINGYSINDNLTISTKLSIVADAFAFEHFSKIKYCTWMGVKWKVTDVKPSRPRLILTLGGEFNGGKATAP